MNAVAFYRGDQPGKPVAEDLLKQYARYSNGKLTWKSVDPDREPGLARRYGVESYGTIVLETKAKSEKVLDAEEEKLTNGLVKVTREGKRVVYVVQGHGEAEVANTERPGFSEAKSAMEKSNYEVKPLVLAREGKVPADAVVVILPGPRNDLFPPELEALDTYIGRGGKVLAMVNPFQNEGLKKYLVKYGFLPELLGRLPVRVQLDTLSASDLVAILTQPREAMVPEYQRLCALDQIQLDFSQPARWRSRESARSLVAMITSNFSRFGSIRS